MTDTKPLAERVREIAKHNTWLANTSMRWDAEYAMLLHDHAAILNEAADELEKAAERKDKPNKINLSTDICIICDEPAVWIRYTQFSGDHPFCQEHAEEESDFGKSDSYKDWVMVVKES